MASAVFIKCAVISSALAASKFTTSRRGACAPPHKPRERPPPVPHQAEISPAAVFSVSAVEKVTQFYFFMGRKITVRDLWESEIIC